MAKLFSSTAVQYTGSIQVSLDRKCIGWAVANYSDVTVSVNNVPLLPSPGANLLGGSVSVMDPRPDGGYYSGVIDIYFTSPGASQLVVLLQIFEI